jgi:hypothetical protein
MLSCKLSQTLIFPLFMTFLCVPLNSQPMERHGLKQGLLCSTQYLYSTYHSGGVEFACVTHKVVWYLRYEQIYGIWGQSEVITNESIVFHFCRRSMWRVMSWERLIVGMDTTHCASSSGCFWKTSAPFAKQLPFLALAVRDLILCQHLLPLHNSGGVLILLFSERRGTLLHCTRFCSSRWLSLVLVH